MYSSGHQACSVVCLQCKILPKGRDSLGRGGAQQQPPASTDSFFPSVRELPRSVEHSLAINHTKLTVAFQPRVESCSLALKCLNLPGSRLELNQPSSSCAWLCRTGMCQQRLWPACREHAGTIRQSLHFQWMRCRCANTAAITAAAWPASFLPTPTSLGLNRCCALLCAAGKDNSVWRQKLKVRVALRYV